MKASEWKVEEKKIWSTIEVELNALDMNVTRRLYWLLQMLVAVLTRNDRVYPFLKQQEVPSAPVQSKK